MARLLDQVQVAATMLALAAPCSTWNNSVVPSNSSVYKVFHVACSWKCAKCTATACAPRWSTWVLVEYLWSHWSNSSSCAITQCTLHISASKQLEKLCIQVHAVLPSKSLHSYSMWLASFGLNRKSVLPIIVVTTISIMPRITNRLSPTLTAHNVLHVVVVMLCG